MNYFEFYGGDYMRDTAQLTLAEHGAYLLLLATYYATERPLPADLQSLYRIARAMSPPEQKAVRSVADTFFKVDDDGLRHNCRADEELRKAIPRIEAARANGKKGGREKAKGSEYMSWPGILYAIRVSTTTVKVGVSGNFKSRMYQHRKKYGHQISVLHSVEVNHMGDAEWDLLSAYESVRRCEELPVTKDQEAQLISIINRIAVAYPVHNESHSEGYATSNATRIALHTPSSSISVENLLPIGEVPTSASDPPVRTLAGEACLLMRAAGIGLTNPSHADLLAALAEGLTPIEIADAAREAVERGKNSMAYAIATARGRRRDKPKIRPVTKPSAADNFQGKTYVGTPIDQLPAELRGDAAA